MMLTDNHTHTHFSTDSEASVREQIEAAIKSGLSGITITDHLDPEFPLDASMFMFDIDEYFKEISPLKDEYKGQINVLIGVEIGMRTDQEKLLNKLAASYPFDTVIGSIHVVENFDPYYPEYWNKYGVKEGLNLFFETTKRCVEMYDFYDSLGHIDYIFRYAPDKGAGFSAKDFPVIDDILRTLIDKDKALEINTAGLKYGLAEPHPCSYVLKRYHELGGRKITIGSDGHKPEHIAYGFETLKGYLNGCGFSEYVRYVGRKENIIRL